MRPADNLVRMYSHAPNSEGEAWGTFVACWGTVVSLQLDLVATFDPSSGDN